MVSKCPKNTDVEGLIFFFAFINLLRLYLMLALMLVSVRS